MKLLGKRAKHLQTENFKKANEVEHKMTELKKAHYDRLVIPNTFFITFQEGFGWQQAMK